MTAATLVIVALLYAAVAIPSIVVLGSTAGGSEAPVAAMLRIAVGPAGAILAALIAVIIATGNTVAWVGSLAELGRMTQPTTSESRPRAARARALVVPILIIIASLAAAALTPIDTGQLVSLCAASQVPVYFLGLAAGLWVFPAYGRSWWLSSLATAAVAVLLIPAGIYLLAPALIAAFVTSRYFIRRRRAAGGEARVGCRGRDVCTD